MRKRIFFIMVLVLILSVTGCGGSASSDKKKAEDAISVYQSYRDGKTDSSQAMTDILKLSTEIKDEELKTLVSGVVSVMAFENMNGTDPTDEQIQKIRDYIANGSSPDNTAVSKNNSKDDPKDIVNDASSFLSDCWNPICDLDWYTGYGTSSTGGELDAEFTIEKFKNAYKDRDEIYKRINTLSGDDYTMAVQAFNKAIEEFDILAKTINDDSESIINAKNSGQHLDINRLQDYVKTFQDERWDIVNN